MKVAIITGASGGIGTTLCSAFKQVGYHVIATDLSCPEAGDDNLEIDLANLVRSDSYRDSKIKQLDALLKGKSLHALINNAAWQKVAPLGDLAIRDFSQSLDVNVSAPFVLAKELMKYLRRVNGSIINMATIHARLTKPEFVAYATSKTALIGLTQSLAVEVGKEVRVNAIAPAAIRTQMLEAGFAGREEAFSQLESFHPVGKIGEPRDIAKLAVFLASNEHAGFINGAVIPVDGGIGARLHDPA